MGREAPIHGTDSPDEDYYELCPRCQARYPGGTFLTRYAGDR